MLIDMVINNNLKMLSAAFVLAATFLLLIFPANAADKVILCHVPPGNEENAHEIEVSTNAVQAHLNHGDHLGACQQEPVYNFDVDGSGGVDATDISIVTFSFGTCTVGSECLADFNENGVVGPEDLSLMLENIDTLILQDFINLFADIEGVPTKSPDLNNDGLVNLDDILVLFSSFGACPGGVTCASDLDDTTAVDIEDLIILFGVLAG